MIDVEIHLHIGAIWIRTQYQIFVTKISMEMGSIISCDSFFSNNKIAVLMKPILIFLSNNMSISSPKMESESTIVPSTPIQIKQTTTKMDMATSVKPMSKSVSFLMEQDTHDHVLSSIPNCQLSPQSKSKHAHNVRVNMFNDQLMQSDHFYSTLNKQFFK